MDSLLYKFQTPCILCCPRTFYVALVVRCSVHTTRTALHKKVLHEHCLEMQIFWTCEISIEYADLLAQRCSTVVHTK